MIHVYQASRFEDFLLQAPSPLVSHWDGTAWYPEAHHEKQPC